MGLKNIPKIEKALIALITLLLIILSLMYIHDFSERKLKGEIKYAGFNESEGFNESDYMISGKQVCYFGGYYSNNSRLVFELYKNFS